MPKTGRQAKLYNNDSKEYGKTTTNTIKTNVNWVQSQMWKQWTVWSDSIFA